MSISFVMFFCNERKNVKIFQLITPAFYQPFLDTGMTAQNHPAPMKAIYLIIYIKTSAIVTGLGPLKLQQESPVAFTELGL